MKKMIVLIGIMMSVTTVVFAGEVVKSPLESYTTRPGMDYIYDMKVAKYEKVVLDCQSFITGMDFTNGNSNTHIPLDMFTCEDLISFLADSKTNNEPVCIGVDSEERQLYITHETDDCK